VSPDVAVVVLPAAGDDHVLRPIDRVEASPNAPVECRSGAETFDRLQQHAVIDERVSIRFASRVQRHLRSVPI